MSSRIQIGSQTGWEEGRKRYDALVQARRKAMDEWKAAEYPGIHEIILKHLGRHFLPGVFIDDALIALQYDLEDFVAERVDECEERCWANDPGDDL